MDLIVVGEWMPISFFKNQGGVFENTTLQTGLKNTAGWWNTIAAGDFNGDGKTDYVVGNLGLNSRLKASENKPLRVYASDFDNNGSVDPIMTRYIQGKEYPVHPRDNLISQIPSMKRRLPRYHLYGEATIEKVLNKEERKNAYQLEANYMKSAFLENLGDGRFELKSLPVEAQISPIQDIQIHDFDKDGHLDILVAGNSYATEIHSGWYDAGIGLMLKGNGKGGFKPLHHTKSGFFVDKDVKSMASIKGPGNQPIVLVASHADSLKAFSWVETKTYHLLEANSKH
jgi:hypothetical protein